MSRRSIGLLVFSLLLALAAAQRSAADTEDYSIDNYELTVQSMQARTSVRVTMDITYRIRSGTKSTGFKFIGDYEVEQLSGQDGEGRVITTSVEHQRETRTFRADDPFVELYFNFLRFLNGLMVSDAAFSHVVEYRKGDGRIKILCKDPSRFLGGVINRAHAAIGLSATLSPPEFYTGLLGFETGRTAFVEIANPFPQENRRVVIDPTIATTYRERPMNYERIAERLASFADTVPGNCLALFPSYAFLSEITGRMRLRNKRVLIQRQADNAQERDLLLQALRSAIFGDILLVAVAGGVFAEGVDYPGEVLKAVAVVGPCLPALTLEQQLLKDYYEERFERGFEYSFVVPGMTRVVQAAGRLIRSPQDTGVIALFDQRFLHAPYRHYLPADWLPEEGAGALVGNPSEVAEEFFRVLSLRR